MNKYVGKKEINATPMTRAAYNVIRGWELPADENGEDEGFLVEYVDGGKANHPDYAGYISWSPKDVFERAYKAADTHIDRLIIEHAELKEKIDKLASFLETETCLKLSVPVRDLLAIQLSTMASYYGLLTVRLRMSGFEL